MKKVKVYMGILGQYGDIVMFTAVIKRIKEMIPNSEITFAISKKYGDMKPLLERDPFIDKVFVTKNYFENLQRGNFLKRKIKNKMFNKGFYFDLRGEDEIKEQAKHNLVFETRPQHKDVDWFKHRHQIEQLGLDIGLKMGDLRTRLYPQKRIPKIFGLNSKRYIVIHTQSGAAHKSWNKLEELKEKLRGERLFIIQEEKTSVIELASIIKNAKLFIGIDSMPIWMASAFTVPTVGIYGSLQYGVATKHIYPKNNRAIYLQAAGHPDKISTKEIMGAVKRLI